jgi:hypothetical protein
MLISNLITVISPAALTFDHLSLAGRHLRQQPRQGPSLAFAAFRSTSPIPLKYFDIHDTTRATRPNCDITTHDTTHH